LGGEPTMPWDAMERGATNGNVKWPAATWICINIWWYLWPMYIYIYTVRNEYTWNLSYQIKRGYHLMDAQEHLTKASI
jgi:hypothetical protein